MIIDKFMLLQLERISWKSHRRCISLPDSYQSRSPPSSSLLFYLPGYITYKHSSFSPTVHHSTTFSHIHQIMKYIIVLLAASLLVGTAHAATRFKFNSNCRNTVHLYSQVSGGGIRLAATIPYRYVYICFSLLLLFILLFMYYSLHLLHSLLPLPSFY